MSKRTAKRNRSSGRVYERCISLTFERATDDDGNDIIDVAISSESDSVLRYFGREILVHEKRAVDLSRLNNVSGWLRNHDPDQLFAAIVNPRVDEGDGVIRVGARFDDTEIGREVKAQVENGSLKGASLRYTYGPRDFVEVAEGDTFRLNGKNIKGPARVVGAKPGMKWAVIEPTLTPVPADASVGVGRGGDFSKKGTTMGFKWKVVASDGSCEHSFARKKEAEDFASEQEYDCEVRKLERGSDSADDNRIDPAPPTPADNRRDADADRTAQRAGAERVIAIQEIGEMSGLRDFADDLARTNPDISVDDARTKIHAKWAESKKKDNKPVGNTEPPSGSSERSIGDLDDDAFVRNLTRRQWADVGLRGTGLLRAEDWFSLVKSSGHQLQERINALFASEKLKPSSVSLRSLYEGLALYETDHGPCMVRSLVRDDIYGGQRAVMSSAFGVIAGSTVIAAVRAGYEDVHRVGDQLVDDYESSAKLDTIPAILTEQSMKEVQEGKPYLEGDAQEEYFTIGSKKQGRIFSLTREMIARDQTGLFLRRANRLGEKAQHAIEKLIFERVTDSVTGFNVYKPSGTGTALYSTSARTRGTNKVATNALVDTTDLDAARVKLAGMTDNEGDPVNVRPLIILVPDALLGTATKILGSELTPGTTDEHNPWGPKGLWQPTIVSSPVLDVISTTAWYLGDPSKQFWMKRAFGIETAFQGRESDAWMTHDVAMRFRVAFDVEVGAVDYVYFVQSTA